MRTLPSMLSLLLASACTDKAATTAPADTPTDTSADTEADADTDADTDADDSGDTEVDEPDVWEDPAWWTEPGPFAPLLDLSNAPRHPHWEVWYTTSPDMKTWTPATSIGFNFSSLDLLVLEEGLIIGGSLTPDPDFNIMAPFEHYFAMVTKDLETWGSHELFIEDAAQPMIIDPSIHRTPDGELQLLFFGSTMDVDPELLPDDYPNPHAIFTAWWDTDRFVQADPEPMLEADYVVDPSGCYYEDRHYVLGTRRYGELYFAERHIDKSDEYLDVGETAVWSGVQVPYCNVQGEAPLFIAQFGGGYGPPQVRWFDEKGFLAEPVDLLDLKAVGHDSCTSPVLGHYREEWVLFCATWIE